MRETVAPPPVEAERAVEVDKPFVGLRPFTSREANLFFGRDHDIRIIVANLQAARLTLLYGPSGVGKSSILAAGVAEELRRQARRNLSRRDRPELAVTVFSSWRDAPVATLASAVEHEVRGLLGPLEDTPRGGSLSDRLAHWSDAVEGPILVVLDQFEEYFFYQADETGSDGFAAQFADAVTRPDINANFLISIREDFYTKLDRFEDDIPQLFENFIRLDHLDLEGARAAIHGPLEEYSRRMGEEVSIDPELVAAILDQVRPQRLAFAYSAAAGDLDEEDDDRIAAPFLQLVLERLWNEERDQGSNVLRRSTFQRLGETKGIVEGHVLRGLEALSEEEQDVAAQAFRFLVTRSGTKVAYTAADLAEFTGLRERTVEPVLEKLVGTETRILTRLPAPRPGGSPSYELYHDLLGEPVLRWRSDRLGAMEKRAAEAKAREERHRANVFRSVAVAMVVIAAICVALFLVARHARNTADVARKVARAQQLVAESEATLPTDPDGALREAEQALEVKPSPQAELAFRTAVGASQLRVAMRHSRGTILRAMYSGDGRRVMTLGTDKTVLLSHARTGRPISRIEYGEDLRDADFSRDGRYVVTAGERDNTVSFWNATTGARLATFHNPALSGAWLDPADGRRAVATDLDGGLQIWRLGIRKPLVLESPALVALTHAAFSPDGRRVVAIGNSNDAWVFDARTRKLLRTLHGHIAPINTVAWSPDSRHLVTGGNDLWWRVWDVTTGRSVGQREDNAVTAVAFSADGTKVATVIGNQADVWNAETAEHIQTLQGHSNVITDVAFRRDGRLVVTGSSDGTARVWDVATGTTLTELRGSGSVVESALFSPNGRFVLTASADRTARIWDVGTGIELWHHAAPVRDAAFSPNGKQVLTGGQDQRILVSDARTGRFLRALPHPPKLVAVNSIRFSQNGKLLIVATDDPHLLVRRANGARIATLTQNPAPVFQAVFSPNSKQIAVADGDGQAGIFDARTGTLRRWLQENQQQKAHPLGAVNSIGWSPDGRFIVTGGSDSQVRVWNAATGGYLRTLWAHVGPVTSVAFAPNADRVVTTGADRTAYVWAIPSGRRLATLRGDPQPLYSAAFNPNGRWIATGDSGGVVRVWDWRAHKMLAAIPAHADLVNAVSFSPDGKRILSASDDWSAKIYPCTSCVPLQELRYRVYKREKLIAP